MQRQRATPPHHKPRHRWAWTGAGLGLALALITQAPAYWLTQTVEHLSGERMLLQDPQGTVWQGSAQWVLNEGPLNTAASSHTAQLANTTALPTRVTWQLGPRVDLAHLRLTLSATLASACCTPQPLQMEISPMWLGVRLTMSDRTSNWPAAWLVGLGAPWNTVQPEGQMQLQTQGLQWTYQAGQTQMQGQAELQLQQLATRLSTLRPLGSYRLRVQGGDTVALTLDTLDGSLRLEGSGQLQNGRVQFNGEASATPDAQAALSNLLNILGSRQGAKSILKMG
ncbi:type II secretion system protein N [Limnohabitans sp.]|uniref:type II secretion system protein N n=1 Tax=Limnohabitans sp. TaxID=1907725 RepID=UPI00286F3D66|nr:type II secretion system protein N [Limnohabitans sp.]